MWRKYYFKIIIFENYGIRNNIIINSYISNIDISGDYESETLLNSNKYNKEESII